MTRTAFRTLLALVTAASVGACNNSSTAPTTTTTTVTQSTELFSGTLSPKGSSFYSFTVASTGTVSITLASTATSKIGPASAAKLRLGLGIPSGFGCSVTSSVDTTSGLSAQISNPNTAAGSSGSIYCVQVSDPGQLTGDVLFVVRIVHT
jgi:hypothetical protein